MEKNIVERVYRKLQDREIHPSGRFDGAGRFYLTEADCVDVRSPSRRWPYSQMMAGRTKKYVKKIAVKYKCLTEKDLLNRI